MKITVSSESLSKALKTAGRVIPAKATNPILESFKLEVVGNKLIVTASNGEITVKIPVRINSSEEDGVCCIPAKKFTEIVSLLPNGDVVLSTESNTMSISWAKGSNKQQLSNDADYPQCPESKADKSIDISAQELLRALSATIPAASKDDLKPMLKGVHFDLDNERLRLVASDTKMLTYDTIACQNAPTMKFTMPTAAASLLKGSIHKESMIARISFDQYNVCVNLGDIIVQSRVLTSKYPDYMKIIPTGAAGTVTIDREGLIGTLKRLATCSSKLKMELSPLSVLFSARNADTGSSSVEDCDCTYNGEPMEIGINTDYALSVLENISAEKVNLCVCDPRKPILAKDADDEGDDCLSIFMPVSMA